MLLDISNRCSYNISMNAAILNIFFNHLSKTAMMESAEGTVQPNLPASAQTGPRISPMLQPLASNPLPGQPGNFKGPKPLTSPGQPIKFNNKV